MSSLQIDDRMGTVHTIGPDQSFTIGRDADLAFPDNPQLHRQLVHLAFAREVWWISNVGGWIPLRIIHKQTGAVSTLRSGSSSVLVGPAVDVVFEAGPTQYEVTLQLAESPQPPSFVRKETRDLTARPGTLNLEQRMLLAAMAEPLLRYPGTGLDRIPSIQAVADRLGWSLTKTNRKLDYLCDKLDADGVSGLVGGGRGSAINRRTRLVEYALDTRMVTPDSLQLLGDRGGGGE